MWVLNSFCLWVDLGLSCTCWRRLYPHSYLAILVVVFDFDLLKTLNLSLSYVYIICFIELYAFGMNLLSLYMLAQAQLNSHKLQSRKFSIWIANATSTSLCIWLPVQRMFC